MTKLRLLFFSAFILFFACEENVNKTYAVSRNMATSEIIKRDYPKNVIIVVIDGPRWDHTFGDTTRKYIPNLTQLQKIGTFYSNCFNLGETRTNPGHVALSTGIYEHLDNQGYTIPSGKSFLHQFLDREKDNALAWIITSKDKLEILSLSKDTSVHLLPMTDCGVNGNGSGYREDSITYERITEVMGKYKPNVIFANFREPDYSAHLNDFEGYYKGLKKSDEYVGKLWFFIQSSDYYKNSTTLIITNDHGRHLDGVGDGLNNHGDDCDGCRRIGCLVLGVGSEPGRIVSDSIDLLGLNRMIKDFLLLE